MGRFIHQPRDLEDQILEEGYRLSANEEGWRSAAYRNAPDEPWTIGFGFTYWPDGSKVRPGQTMSREQGEAFLRDQVQRRLLEVASCIDDDVERKMGSVKLWTPLISLHHNLGHTQFRTATFIKRINQENWRGAADAFLWWKRGNFASDLLPRRKRERQLFLEGATDAGLLEKGA